MAQIKTFEELEIGDIFLTEDINGGAVKLTVKEKFDDDRLILVHEINGFDLSLEEFYVVGHKENKNGKPNQSN